MPKSNFNQFIDECDDFTSIGIYNKTSKISFETNESKNETNQTNQTNQTNANALSHKPPVIKSSNIFLSKNVNKYTTTTTNCEKKVSPIVNDGNSGGNANESINKNVNIFKKMDINLVSTTPSSTVIEINNDTFPSLLSAHKPSTKKITDGNGNGSGKSGGESSLKKIKNFKDAICSAALTTASVQARQSPTKQKNININMAYNNFPPPAAAPLPSLVKRGSEMFAKKMLIKTNATLSQDYDSDNDNDYECDDGQVYNLNNNYRYNSYNKCNNGNNDDSDYDY
jgi:hypothetical protein